MEVRPPPTAWGLLRASPKAPHPRKPSRTTEGVGRGPSPWVGRETLVAGAPGGKSPEPRHPPPSGRLPTTIREVWQGRGLPRTRCPQQSGSNRQWFKHADTGIWAQRGQGWPGEGAQKTLPLPRGLPASGRGRNTARAESLPGPGGQARLLLPLPVSPLLSPVCLCAECVSPTRKRGWAEGGALRPPGTASSPLLRQWRL